MPDPLPKATDSDTKKAQNISAKEVEFSKARRQSIFKPVAQILRSEPRFAVQIILMIIGTALFCGTVFLWKSPTKAIVIVLPVNSSGMVNGAEVEKAAKENREAIEQEDLKNISKGISSSLILVGLIDFMIRLLSNVTTTEERRKFEKFFGVNVSSKKGMTAIFFTAHPADLSVIEKNILEGLLKKFSGLSSSEEDISREIKKHLKWVECPYALDANKVNAQPKGIQSIVPFPELKAVLGIQKLFSYFGLGESFEIEQDKGTPESMPEDRTVLAVGLGFNSATKNINEYCGDLFSIDYLPLNQITDLISDDFSIRKEPGNYGIKKHALPSDAYDYALFSRVIYRERVYLVCAGRTATGTEAACQFLAKNWLVLMNTYYHNFDNVEYDLSTHSMAVILKHHNRNLEDCKIEDVGFQLGRQ
jgi:hypothetical protein